MRLCLLVLFSLFSLAMAAQEVEKDGDANTVIVEKAPEFRGGLAKLFEYLRKKLNYPKEARNKGIEGKVMVSFIIDKTGKIIDVSIIRGVHYLLDEEALRVVSNMPNWKPGTQRGKPVKVRYTLPINFKL